MFKYYVISINYYTCKHFPNVFLSQTIINYKESVVLLAFYSFQFLIRSDNIISWRSYNGGLPRTTWESLVYAKVYVKLILLDG